jgi:hypothetical protein
MVALELVVVAVFATLVLVAWAPLLGIERVRALLAWPTRWLVVNYLLVGTGVVVVQCLSYLVVLFLVAGTGTVTGGEAAGIVGGVVAANVLVPGTGALAALQLLPARGYWSPDCDGIGGRVALGLGVLWYAVVTSVGFIVVGLAVMFANLPM